MEYRLLLTAKGQGTQFPALFAAKKNVSISIHVSCIL